jgi:oligoribonuclease NrnB/cAMP/cGMP phosphodiesterase (DHH superfamily)
MNPSGDATLEKKRKIVHVISHGPHCLDGVAAAVAVARYHDDATVLTRFSSNQKIDETILALRCDPPSAEHHVWITDISWTSPEAEAHLCALARQGAKIHWIDHHRTAIERVGAGNVKVPFTDSVVRDDYAASRLAYEHLAARLQESGRKNPAFEDLWPLIEMADDNDRWLHRVEGSRELALTVRAMGGPEAYEDLLTIDRAVTYTPRMRAAAARIEAELKRSFEVAESSRVTREIHRFDLTLVAAVCDGYPSEIADAWGKRATRTVFALFDATSLSISLRRSPDCTVDLSRLAAEFGGGGHAAAAGCDLPDLRRLLADEIARRLSDAIPKANRS